MEKAAIVFSALTHDFEIMLWFWGLITLPVGIWHIFYFPRDKQFTAKQLAEISPRFKDLDSNYMVYSFIGIGLFMLLPYLIVYHQVDAWSVANFGMRFYPGITVFTVGYAIYQATFALYAGVYPMAKSLSYAYDEKAVIDRVAKHQIIIALVTLSVVLVFFVITAG